MLTLVGAYEHSFQMGREGEHRSQTVRASAVLEGPVWVQKEDRFDVVRVNLDGLARWVRTASYTENPPPVEGSDHVVDHVTLLRPPTLEAEVDNGRVRLKRYWAVSHSVDGVTASAEARWEFEAEEPMTFQEVFPLGERPLHWMTLLLTGRAVSVNGLQLRVEDESFDEWKRWVNVHGRPDGRGARRSESLLVGVAVDLDELGDSATSVITRYWAFHQRHGAALWPLMQQLNRPETLPLESTFFMLTVCAESYHHSRSDLPQKQFSSEELNGKVAGVVEAVPVEQRPWVDKALRQSNSLTLAKRLEALGAESGVAPRVPYYAESTSFIARCRNAMAHGRFSSDDMTPVQMESIIKAEEILQFLLHACVLIECGLEREKVHHFLARQPRYQLADLGGPPPSAPTRKG